MAGVEFPVNIPVSGVDGLQKAAAGAGALGDALNAANKALGRFRDASGRMREANGRFVKMGDTNGDVAKMGDAAGTSMTKAVAGGMLLASAIESVGRAALDAAVALVRMGAQAALAFGKAVIEAAAFGQKAELAIGLLSAGSNAKKELASVVGIVRELGLPLEDTVKSFQKLLAMQFKPEQAKQLIKMGADLQAIGASAEEVQGALLAISQIKAKGRVQAEELLQLAERGVSTELVLEALGKRLGKTTDEVRKLMQAGKIAADVGIDAIGDAVKKKTGTKEFGEAGKKFAETTLQGMFNKLKAVGSTMMMEIGSRILKPLEAAIAPIVKDIFKAMESPEAKSAVDGIVQGFNKMSGVLAAAWPSVKAFVGGLVDGLKPLKDMVAGFIDVLGPVLDALGIDAKDAAGGARLLGQGLALVIGAAVMLGGLIVGVVGFFAAIPAAIFGAAASVAAFSVAIVKWVLGLPEKVSSLAGTLSASAASLGNGIITGIVSGITNGLSLVTNAVKNVATTALTTAKATLGIHSPSSVMRDQVGMQMGAGIALGVSDSAPAIRSATTAAVVPPTRPAVGFGGGGGGGSNTFAPVFTFNVNGAALGDNPAAAAQSMAAEVERRIDAVMSRWAAEVGL